MNRFFIFLIFLSYNCFSQNTVGLVEHTNSVTEGYILFTPEKNDRTYLINECGEVINSWQFSELPGLTAYLLEDGNILRAGKDSLEIRDWNNNLIWSYSMTSNNLPQHHDIEPLPNGNILAIISDNYSKSEIAEYGRDTSNFTGKFRLDKIIEIKPIYPNNIEIVWEWKFIDHTIQDFDNTKQNFGNPNNYPHLLNINYDNGQGNDYTHINAVDYNKTLNQILLSSRSLDEIYIIDHSTTIGEASTGSGGNAAKGGDILWRWGNPKVYNSNYNGLKQLFGQHDARWIEDTYQDSGKISVFNNFCGLTGDYSCVSIIDVENINQYNYELQNGFFLPNSTYFNWHGEILGTTVFENKKSSSNFLKNGNFIVCETSKGRITELDRQGNIIWLYVNPSGVETFNQNAQPSLNGIFRAEKYLPSFPGFDGKDMTPKGIIENENTLSQDCNQLTFLRKKEKTTSKIYPNPVQDLITIPIIYLGLRIKITNIEGKVVYDRKLNDTKISTDFTSNNGLFFLQVFDKSDNLIKVEKISVIK